MDAKGKERLRLKADVFKAMGHPIRLGILEFLSTEERCVCEIVDYAGTDISNISKHLSVLKRSGLVDSRKEGLKVFYSLTMPCALDFAGCVEGIVINRLEEQRALMAD